MANEGWVEERDGGVWVDPLGGSRIPLPVRSLCVNWFLPPAGRLALSLLWAVLPAAGAQTVVRAPPPEGASDTGDVYFAEVLELALDETNQTDGPFLIRYSPESMPVQRRGIRYLESGRELDVLWMVTTRECEARLRPIRIPLLRGLAGWRLLLIQRKDQPRFAEARDLADLRQFRAGLGESSPEVAVMKAHGLKVMTGRSYEGLFTMLQKGRFDYMPRGIAEIYGELASHRDAGFVVEEHLMLHYAAAVYLFVNKKNEALASRLERGLRSAIADGRLNALFRRHFHEILARARVSERTVIEMSNPLLPDSVPLDEKDLWQEIPGR